MERKPKLENGVKIAFVEGHGNSNSPKYYSYSDKSLTTSGKYLYRLKQVDIDGTFEYSDAVEVNFGAPEDFVLNQNYPNPFNPTTSIQFTIPLDSRVRLSVFNVLGEEVAELVNQNFAAGYHSVDFNGSKLNSGIYFYKLEANNFMQIRKMMLVK
ncbi:MAG: T9SS type A sorting domain-containing protein [Ignavibacteriales bacterium]|nr:T9SS type A sorting domain-containing protein [Ignavibacteriales bacterium]